MPGTPVPLPKSQSPHARYRFVPKRNRFSGWSPGVQAGASTPFFLNRGVQTATEITIRDTIQEGALHDGSPPVTTG
jgi:hypothetical protein